MLTVDELIQYNSLEKLRERMGRVVDYIETLRQHQGQPIPEE